MFIEVSMVRRSHFVIFNFLQGKVVCFGTRFQVARLLGPCLLCVEKKLSFGCVCSLKMELLKRVSPVLFGKKKKW